MKLPPNHDSHSGYDEEDPEHDCRCHLKAGVQPVAHARDGVDRRDAAVDPFMEPHVEPRERTPEEDLQDAEHHHCHAYGFHTSTIGLTSPKIEVNPDSRSFAELLIDCEEVRTLRAVLVGMLRRPRPVAFGGQISSGKGDQYAVAGH